MLHRLSDSSSPRTPNDFWLAYQPLLDQLFEPSEPAHMPIDDLRKRYTPRRLRTYDTQTSEQSVRRVTERCSELTSEDIDFHEAEVINWLLDDHTHLVLNIVGTRGTGKTSLVHYVFRALTPNVDRLQRFDPILLDLREDPDSSLDLHVYNTMLDALDRKYNDVPYSERVDYSKLPFDAKTLSNSVASRSLVLSLFDQWNQDCLERHRTPIVIFDNCDKLDPTSVIPIMSLSRALALRLGMRVVLALRPFTLRTSMERAAHLNGFFTYSLSVSPPDLVDLIHRRLTTVIMNPRGGRTATFTRANTGLHVNHTVEFGDPETAIRRFTKYFLQVDVQSEVLSGLCNNDVRRSLAAIRSFLRGRTLPIRAFFPAALLPEEQSNDHTLKAARRQSSRDKYRSFDLLKGIMIDDRPYYRDTYSHASSPVLNIFDLRSDDPRGPTYLIQPRILTLLASEQLGLNKENLQTLLLHLGYSVQSIQHAVYRLLERGLLDSPQHDEDLFHAELVSLSLSGRYYLDTLLGDPEYLCNVICDVPLKHREWRHDSLDDFAPRVHSLVELLSILIERENEELVMSDEQHTLSSLAIAMSTSVSARVFDGIIDSLESARRSDQGTVRGFGRRMLTEVRSQFSDPVDLLTERFNNAISNDIVENRVAIPGGGVVRVQVPRQLEPRHSGLIKVSIDDDEAFGNIPVTAFLDVEAADVLSARTAIPLGARRGHRAGQWHIRSRRRRSCGIVGSIILPGAGEPFACIALQDLADH